MEKDVFIDVTSAEYFEHVRDISVEDFLTQNKDNLFEESLKEIETVISQLKSGAIGLKLTKEVILISNGEWIKLFVSDKSEIRTSLGNARCKVFDVSDKILHSLVAEAVFVNGYKFITIPNAISLLQ
jgi:hypothetical protein